MVVGEAPWHTVKGTYMHTNYRLYPVLRVCKVSSSSNSSSINPSTTLSTVSFGHNRLEVRVGVLCSCNKLSRQAFSSSEGARTKLSYRSPAHANDAMNGAGPSKRRRTATGIYTPCKYLGPPTRCRHLLCCPTAKLASLLTYIAQLEELLQVKCKSRFSLARIHLSYPPNNGNFQCKARHKIFGEEQN